MTSMYLHFICMIHKESCNPQTLFIPYFSIVFELVIREK